MRVVDTSAWIEWLVDSPTAALIKPELPPRRDWLTPTIIQLELAKWLSREVGEDAANRAVAFSRHCRVAPLDTDTALLAADLASAWKLSVADAIIYATAQREGADLLTCDSHFSGLPGVTYIAKHP